VVVGTIDVVCTVVVGETVVDIVGIVDTVDDAVLTKVVVDVVGCECHIVDVDEVVEVVDVEPPPPAGTSYTAMEFDVWIDTGSDALSVTVTFVLSLPACLGVLSMTVFDVELIEFTVTLSTTAFVVGFINVKL